MLYPIAIAMGDETHAYGVTVPDVPGCFSAGDSLEEAFINAKEAIAFHIEGMLEDGDEIPHPQSIELHKANPEYKDLLFSVVDVDLTHLMGKSEKINVTLPLLLIRRIDALVARSPLYKNRSDFLAKVSAEKII